MIRPPRPLRRRRRLRRRRLPLLIAATAILGAGCHDDGRLARLATEAADRQAAQNAQVADMAARTAAGAERLVAAEAEARRTAAALHRELQQERQALCGGWLDLHQARDALARQRQTAASRSDAARGLAAAAVVWLALSVTRLALSGAAAAAGDGTTAWDVLVDRLLEDGTPAPTTLCLRHPLRPQLPRGEDDHLTPEENPS